MHIHILAIAGSMTAPLALELKRLGHKVTGSDQSKTYPPFGPKLQRAKIPINNLDLSTTTPDLTIVGSAFNKFDLPKKEFGVVRKHNLPYISSTKYLANNLIKNNSIVIAGSFGKTTITSLITWILLKSGFNPSYFFGGLSINKIPSCHINNSKWSVIEGDESINGLDTKAKFLYYRPKYLILTSAGWEHKDSYASSHQNQKAFINLIKSIPKDGLLIYNSTQKNILPLLPHCKSPKIAYKPEIKYVSPLLGQFNQENISAAYTLCKSLSIPSKKILSAISSFKGIKRRLELIKKTGDVYFYDDFAQSSERISQVLKTINANYPKHKIKVFFEPHASFLRNIDSVKSLKYSFKLASEVVISKIYYSTTADKQNRVTAKDFNKYIGTKSLYLPLFIQIANHYHQSLKNHQILIHFSSGGLNGLKTFKKIITNFNLHKTYVQISNKRR